MHKLFLYFVPAIIRDYYYYIIEDRPFSYPFHWPSVLCLTNTKLNLRLAKGCTYVHMGTKSQNDTKDTKDNRDTMQRLQTNSQAMFIYFDGYRLRLHWHFGDPNFPSDKSREWTTWIKEGIPFHYFLWVFVGAFNKADAPCVHEDGVETADKLLKSQKSSLSSNLILFHAHGIPQKCGWNVRHCVWTCPYLFHISLSAGRWALPVCNDST